MNFQQGLSGLNATSKSLEVIGNNIANAGTYGAKASRAEFADMYANSLGSAGSAGIGVRLQTVAQQFSQGSLNATSNAMDVAINGEGFFQLKSGTGETLYSRNGQFKVDSEGYIVNGQSQRLQGYGADQQGVIQTGVRTDLQFPAGGLPPRATDSISIALNFDSRSTATMPAPPTGVTYAINLDDATTYNNATSVRSYDAKGQPVDVAFYFQKSATDTWNVYAAVGSKVLETSSEAKPIIQGLKFDLAGLNPKDSNGDPLGSITLPRWWRGVLVVGLMLALGGVGWLARLWVPPATLRLTEVALATVIDDVSRAPDNRLVEIDAAQLAEHGLFAYTAIQAPLGLQERIQHVWMHEGREIDRITLDIHGGRAEGYRAWTRKQNFPPAPGGRWQVRVLTGDEQMIGTLRFRVRGSATAVP